MSPAPCAGARSITASKASTVAASSALPRSGRFKVRITTSPARSWSKCSAIRLFRENGEV
jgi:hypothetical protein